MSKREGDEKLPEHWRRYREEGDPVALSHLLARYQGLVRVTIRRMKTVSISPEDREDLESRLNLRLLQLIKSCEKGKETQFQSYAIASLRGEVLSFWRDSRWEGRKVTADRLRGEVVPERDMVSLTAAFELAEKVPDEAPTPEERALARAEYEEAVSRLLKLPERDREVLVGLYFRGMTKAALAREMGWSPATIANIERRALARIKEMETE